MLGGGASVSAVGALGSWAAYNASYGLSSGVVPTVEALRCILPPCLETLCDHAHMNVDPCLHPSTPRMHRETLALVLRAASHHQRPLLC
eukprot:COSAG01_NODE_8015_length_2953_cov_2.655571_3_plen_89_part_00